MSSLIQPSQALPSTPRATSLAPSGAMRALLAPQTSPLSESEAPVSLDTLPSTPPPDVVAQIQTAGANYEGLRAQGYEVHYSYDEQARKTIVQLLDSSGTVVKTLSPAEAVELAMGGTDGTTAG
ncbi:MAG TPA: hypothetical protein VGP17_00785 [Solirubrobacteraceae bacterium]|nr:hypothetical protein [Solirubrobacteraceae bacterium]